METPPMPVSECKKTVFESHNAAKKRLNEIRSTSDRDKVPLRSYRCEKCGKVHLTSITKVQQKKIEYRKTPEYRIAKVANEWIRKKGWDIGE